MNIYKLSQLKTFIKNDAKALTNFKNFAYIEFSFPKPIKTILFVHFNKLGYNEYEVCARLYASDNPQETGEDHIGRLFIRFNGEKEVNKYKTTIEQFEYHSDGSFTIITEDGVRNHIKKSF